MNWFQELLARYVVRPLVQHYAFYWLNAAPVNNRIIKFPETKWFEVKNKTAESADIYIYDEISPYLAGSNAKDVVLQLQALKDVPVLNVHINSPGGSVFEGMAIYNSLAKHPGEVVVHIDGLAASIASVIAMAGKKIIIARNAMMMIHLPSSFAWGTAKDLRSTADVLDQLEQTIAGVYAARTGADKATVKDWMNSGDKWFTADEAIKAKLADEVFEGVQAAAKFDIKQYGFNNLSEDQIKLLSPAPKPEHTSTVAPRQVLEKKVALLEKHVR